MSRWPGEAPMPADECRAGVRLGDIAAGDGYVGVVADLPGGRVGIALFGYPGQPRRIVHIASEDCKLVRRSWEWESAGSDQRDVAQQLWARTNADRDRER